MINAELEERNKYSTLNKESRCKLFTKVNIIKLTSLQTFLRILPTTH